jgi:hypothetical protein
MNNRYTVLLCDSNFHDVTLDKSDYIRFDDVTKEEIDVLLKLSERQHQFEANDIDLVIRAFRQIDGDSNE